MPGRDARRGGGVVKNSFCQEAEAWEGSERKKAIAELGGESAVPQEVGWVRQVSVGLR